MADMDVTAKFRADISDMKSKMDQISRSLDGMQRSTKQASGGFTVLKGAIGTAFGGAIIGGVYAAGRAIAGFASSSIDAASTMEELQSKVNAIFGSQAGAQIEAWSATASKAFGQSQIQAQNAASTFAIFGKAAGLSGDGLVEFSTGLTELSSDLASFYDASPEEAAQAIGAALRGETEPIRRFGVLLDDATMRQKAFEMGLISSTKNALQPSQKALVAQALIMQQTSDAQGDFARTSDGLANSQRSLSAVIEDVKAQVGTALLPAITSITQAIAPVIQQLAGPFAQVAQQLGTVLTQAFTSIGPAIGPLVGVLSQIIEIVGGALVNVLATLIPALMPILDVFSQIAGQAGPLFAQILQKVADVLAAVLGAVMPLLPPLVDLIFGILNAAWPIIETVADVLLILVDAIAPLLGSVVALLVPLGELVEVLLAAIMPVIKPLLPVIKALAEVLSDVLGRAIALLMAGIGGLIVAFSKLAPFILRNVTKPVVSAFLSMAKGVVGAAANMLGWVPGLGDKLRAAETAISTFAINTETNIGKAADAIEAEGGRIGNEMVAQGTRALAAAGPALGAAAAQTGRYVASRYSSAMEEGMRGLSAGAGATPPVAPAPLPTPAAAPSPSGSSAGADEASKREEKRIAQIQKFVDNFEKALDRIKSGQTALNESTKRAGSEFAQALGDMLPESEIQQAFGPSGSIGSVISQYDQLDAAVNDLYKPLMNVKRFGKAAAQAAKANMASAKAFLKSATETALTLQRAKAANVKALEKADTDYQAAINGINSTYDALDKSAADNLKAIEKRWDSTIATLEGALSRSTEAFNKENQVLQDLIGARNGFLQSLASGARSFLNNLSIPIKKAAKEVEKAIPAERIKRTIKEYANGLRVTIETEVEPAMQALEEATGSEALRASDIGDALQERLTAIREFSNNIRTLMARGLDSSLIKDFVSAGVSGAGEAAAALVAGTDADLASINAAQAALATEIADFQQYASQQWFDAGIAQQEAIVAPLAAARDQAQAALSAANDARANEIAAAQAHAESLRVQRQQALDAAKAQYEAQKEALKQQGVEIDTALTENATNLHNSIAALQGTVPPEMFKAGQKSVNRMLAGFKDKFPGMKQQLNNKMDNLAASMNRTATVTVRTVYEGGSLDGRRALGGPVAAQKAYLVGERGPEVFVPGMYGNIIPNNMLGSMGSGIPLAGRAGSGGNVTNISVNVAVAPLSDPAETGRQVVEAIRKYERRSGPVFVSAG